ncbi:MAG: protein-L-isoaspartate(D-aspartate) O-methyltransferase [Candidatus Omnitrophota bacterium]
MDLKILRERMVEEQIFSRGISNKQVLDVFKKVERHKFLPAELTASAYADYPLPIGEGQTISQPYIVALMTDSLGLTGKEKVLEIGTGSGYQTVILAELAQEVYTIERFKDLLEKAENLFKELCYKNIKTKLGDGSLGWEEAAPFDRIIITAACPRIPLPLIGQLKEGGKIVLPLGLNLGQMLTLAEKKQGKIITTDICGCMFVPLLGKYGIKSD